MTRHCKHSFRKYFFVGVAVDWSFQGDNLKAVRFGVSMKTVKWFRPGDLVPSDARYLFNDGDVFYYEVPVPVVITEKGRYRLRLDGFAEIESVEGNVCAGRIEGRPESEVCVWHSTGRYRKDGMEHPFDIIEKVK